jgi:hypothetical protein
VIGGTTAERPTSQRYYITRYAASGFSAWTPHGASNDGSLEMFRSEGRLGVRPAHAAPPSRSAIERSSMRVGQITAPSRKIGVRFAERLQDQVIPGGPRAGVLAPERICADRIGAIEKIVGEFAGKR